MSSHIMIEKFSEEEEAKTSSYGPFALWEKGDDFIIYMSREQAAILALTIERFLLSKAAQSPTLI